MCEWRIITRVVPVTSLFLFISCYYLFYGPAAWLEAHAHQDQRAQMKTTQLKTAQEDKQKTKAGKNSSWGGNVKFTER
jgi:hypothetical protein